MLFSSFHDFFQIFSQGSGVGVLAAWVGCYKIGAAWGSRIGALLEFFCSWIPIKGATRFSLILLIFNSFPWFLKIFIDFGGGGAVGLGRMLADWGSRIDALLENLWSWIPVKGPTRFWWILLICHGFPQISMDSQRFWRWGCWRPGSDASRLGQPGAADSMLY